MSSSFESLGLLIKRAQHRHHRMLDTKLASTLGVSLVQWNALREIHRNPACPMHRLAELTFNSDQAFGTLTARLLRLSLVKRRAGKGRAVILSLTAKGETLFQEGRKLTADVLARSFSTLSEDERALLSDLLTKLLNPQETSGHAEDR